VLGYSALLVAALALFAGAAYVILKQSLTRTASASLRQTAYAAEQIIAPPNIPRVAVREEEVPPGPGDVEALRRRIRLATGDELNIYVARTGDVEKRALASFGLTALLLIPVTALAAALAGWSMAERTLQPLSRLVEASREIGIGALSRRVEEPARPAEMRELALALNGMLERLQRAVEALRRFTADASHELRTPLTVIRGQLEVALARERPAEELRETMGEVLEETRAMLHLVEDLLALARGEESEARALAGPVDVVGLLHEAAETGAVLAAGKPVEVRVEAPPSLVVSGQAGPLRRLLVNLVSNAVKFTDRGTVTLSARRLGPDEAPGPPPANGGGHAGAKPREWIEVAVADTGAGIAAEELPRVFDRFYRVDAARERSGGTGLGLAIARMIAEQHGGVIEAESEPGRGSVFRVRLPV
jgi:signal transduction histidine kinase